jgi:hypothetical protein
VLLRTVRFFAVILTALALVPAGAHFFELPNKIRLSQEQYFTVQGIYRGWLLMVASLAIFSVWTYPANQATANWIVAPANWASLT